MERMTTRELDNLPTLSNGWCGDLKVDDGATRVWLYRVGLADGAPFENTVQVERLRDGRWATAYFYNGDNVAEEAT
jgi:hypothetical protein